MGGVGGGGERGKEGGGYLPSGGVLSAEVKVVDGPAHFENTKASLSLALEETNSA